jgi:hypothetical protein
MEHVRLTKNLAALTTAELLLTMIIMIVVLIAHLGKSQMAVAAV